MSHSFCLDTCSVHNLITLLLTATARVAGHILRLGHLQWGNHRRVCLRYIQGKETTHILSRDMHFGPSYMSVFYSGSRGISRKLCSASKRFMQSVSTGHGLHGIRLYNFREATGRCCCCQLSHCVHGIRNVRTELRSTEKDAHLGNGESCRLLPWFDISHTVERIVPF